MSGVGGRAEIRRAGSAAGGAGFEGWVFDGVGPDGGGFGVGSAEGSGESGRTEIVNCGALVAIEPGAHGIGVLAGPSFEFRPENGLSLGGREGVGEVGGVAAEGVADAHHVLDTEPRLTGDPDQIGDSLIGRGAGIANAAEEILQRRAAAQVQVIRAVRQLLDPFQRWFQALPKKAFDVEGIDGLLPLCGIRELGLHGGGGSGQIGTGPATQDAIHGILLRTEAGMRLACD